MSEEVSTRATPSNRPFVHQSVQSLFSLAGRTVVITGGARGLGLAWAFAVAESGGNVAVLDHSDQVDADFYLLAQRFTNQSFRTYKVDVTDAAAVQSVIDRVVVDFGRIDGLVTAAGICIEGAITDREPESVARVFSVNVLGTYFAAQSVIRQIKKQDVGGSRRGGSIVLVASMSGYISSQHQKQSDYMSSKGAIHSLARALGHELAPSGIRVNSVSPGYTLTDMTSALMDKNPKLAGSMRFNAPMGRMADLVELKGVIAYLLSDASSYQTEEDIIIAGGIHIGRSESAETAP